MGPRNFLLRNIFDNTCSFPGGSDDKAFAYNAGDPGLIPGSGRAPGEGNGNPLQYFAWEIPWTEEPVRLYTVQGLVKSQTRLSK